MQALKERQETPDTPEALACIPSLQLADIPKQITTVPIDESSIGATTVLTHDLFTSNVLYTELALPLARVPARLLPLLPLFCRALTEMGTEKESFVQLTERIDRATGGLSVSPMVSHKRGSAEPVALLMVRCSRHVLAPCLVNGCWCFRCPCMCHRQARDVYVALPLRNRACRRRHLQLDASLQVRTLASMLHTASHTFMLAVQKRKAHTLIRTPP